MVHLHKRSRCNNVGSDHDNNAIKHRTTRTRTSRITHSKLSAKTLFFLFALQSLLTSPTIPLQSPIPIVPSLPPVAASGILTDLATQLHDQIFDPEDLDFSYDDDATLKKTLNIVEISEMRARDIKRRLARSHGYGSDELAKMIDKKDLINALSYEEHKVFQVEMEKRRWRRYKRMMFGTFVAVVVVMFWPLLSHAFEVAHVNLVVYTDKRRHEISRCREFHSLKGYFGILLLFLIDILSLWLSLSVLLSWVMTSQYFFPVPHIPIRPAELLTPKGGNAGALGKYGINVGPMVISWLFRFLNGRVEGMIGRAMAEAFQRKRMREKEVMKERRREEKRKEKEQRREFREIQKRAKRMEEEEKKKMGVSEEQSNGFEAGHYQNGTHGDVSSGSIPSNDANKPSFHDLNNFSEEDFSGGTSSNFDELD